MSTNGVATRGLGGGQPDVRCPKCDARVESDWDWCHNCGYDPDNALPRSRARAAALRRTGTAGTTSDPASARSEPTSGSTAAPPSAPPRGRPTGLDGVTSAAVAPAAVRPNPPVDPWPVAAPRRRPRRLLVVGAIVVVVLGAAAVVYAHRGPSAAARGRQLSAQLVTAADLPRGWTVVPPARPLDNSSLACLGQLVVPADAPANFTIAAIGLRSGTGNPYLLEEVGTFPGSAASAQWDTLMSEAFHGCPSTGAHAATRRGVVAPRLSMLVGPPRGDQSATFTARLGDGTVVDVLMVRSGRTISVLQVAGQHRVDSALFARAAAGAMRGLER